MYSPRIYTYKITFDEVPYYYYGMHEEKVYGETYWGSPVTNKWCWKMYTPKKQILELFNTRREAYEVEKRLIKPFLNDKWCLNRNVGGIVSKDLYVKIGKMVYERGLGIHSQTKEERIKVAREGGKRAYEMKTGVHGRTKEQMTEDGRKSAKTHRKNKTGTFDPERKLARKGGKVAGRLNVENGHLQKISEMKYICLVTGHISSTRGLDVYQNSRGIDKSQRKLLSSEEYREKTKKFFTVVSKYGEVFTGNDIDLFCKEHKLNKLLFIRVLDGINTSHRGFHLPGNKLKFYIDFTIRTPEGKLVRETNISRFCRNHSTETRKITVSGIHSLIRGNIKQYKGFTLVENHHI